MKFNYDSFLWLHLRVWDYTR